MAEAEPTTNGGSGIGAILAAGDRDFLVRNSGEQVKPSPVLCLWRSSLLPARWSWRGSLIGAVRGRIVCPRGSSLLRLSSSDSFGWMNDDPDG